MTKIQSLKLKLQFDPYNANKIRVQRLIIIKEKKNRFDKIFIKYNKILDSIAKSIVEESEILLFIINILVYFIIFKNIYLIFVI